MRWTTWILGALLAAALAAPPAQAVVVNLKIIDTQGSAVPGYTFVFNWPGGKTTSLNTDSTGLLKGDVPRGEHFCSLWLEGRHLASGLCNLTDSPGSDGDSGNNPAAADSEKTAQEKSIAPARTASEKAAAKTVRRAEAMSIRDRKKQAVGSWYWSGPSLTSAADHLILLSGKESYGGFDSFEFGVVLAQLFGIDGGGDDGGGDGGDGN